jgi:hypothetical protein
VNLLIFSIFARVLSTTCARKNAAFSIISQLLGRGHPARALAGAGRSRDSGQDARAAKVASIEILQSPTASIF